MVTLSFIYKYKQKRGKIMIYTVTFNPSVDYIVGLEKLMPNRVNRTREELIYPGGKGINVSIVLKNLGIDSIALGFLAGDTGVMIQNMLQKEGIFTDFVTIEEGMSRINVKIKENGTTEINGMGPKISTRDRNQLYEKLERLEENDILVLAGSIPESMPDTSYVDIMRFLEKRNVKIVVDATKELLTNVLPLHPFLIKPNHHELGEIFDTEIKTKEEALYYARQLKEKGAENVLVSMASLGAVFVSEDGTAYMEKAPGGVPVNPVGAGDSMVAGFLAGYLENKNYKNAFQMGVATGSASACSVGFATRDAVLSLRTEMNS